jgi:hypothetical protein
VEGQDLTKLNIGEVKMNDYLMYFVALLFAAPFLYRAFIVAKEHKDD